MQSSEAWRLRFRLQVVFNVGMISIAVLAAWFAQPLGLIAATLTYYAVNSISVAVIVSLSSRTQAYGIWRTEFAHTAVSFAASGAISYALYLALRWENGVVALLPHF